MSTEKLRKSEALTKEELAAFKKQYNSFHTKIDAEYAFGVKRQILDMVALRGSGRSDTIAAIREKLGLAETARA